MRKTMEKHRIYLRGNIREQGRAGDPLLMKDAVFI